MIITHYFSQYKCRKALKWLCKCSKAIKGHIHLDSSAYTRSYSAMPAQPLLFIAFLGVSDTEPLNQLHTEALVCEAAGLHIHTGLEGGMIPLDFILVLF